MMKSRLVVSNYKISVFVSSPLNWHGKLSVAKPFDPKSSWVFTVYKHKKPSKFINVTGIRDLLPEWKHIKKVIKKVFQVSIEKMQINNVFATQNLAKHKLSFCLKAIRAFGIQQYGEHFMFYLEPEISPALHIRSRSKPTISFMCYGTGSACIFLTDVHQLYLVEKMLDQFYVEGNLKQNIPRERLLKKIKGGG